MGSNNAPLLQVFQNPLTPFPPPRMPPFPNGTDPEITLDWALQVHKAARERQILGILDKCTAYERDAIVDALEWLVVNGRGSHECDEQ